MAFSQGGNCLLSFQSLPPNYQAGAALLFLSHSPAPRRVDTKWRYGIVVMNGLASSSCIWGVGVAVGGPI